MRGLMSSNDDKPDDAEAPEPDRQYGAQSDGSFIPEPGVVYNFPIETFRRVGSVDIGAHTGWQDPRNPGYVPPVDAPKLQPFITGIDPGFEPVVKPQPMRYGIQDSLEREALMIRSHMDVAAGACSCVRISGITFPCLLCAPVRR